MTKFILNDFHRDVPDTKLIKDLLRVKDVLKNKSVSIHKYDEIGKYCSRTLIRRFGTWNEALKKSGLVINNHVDISDKELFDNLKIVWEKLGRQPVRRDIKKPLSKFNELTYTRHFGSWRKALIKFAEYINKGKHNNADYLKEKIFRHKTQRNISYNLRFRILLRDGFTCQSCGSSPVKERGVQLHVDHKIPWSKGGETVPENLITMCSKCNLGKGNNFDL